MNIPSTKNSNNVIRRIGSRDEEKSGSWRPSSMFDGLWSSSIATIHEKSESKIEGAEEDEDDDEKQRTLKGQNATAITPAVVTPRPSTSNTTSTTKARLSTMFTDWIGGESSMEESIRPRIVSGPIAVSSPSVSNTPTDLKQSSAVQGDSGTEESDQEENVESLLETLMVSKFLIIVLTQLIRSPPKLFRLI